MTSPVGINVLLEGPAGTGKTYSIGTLVEHFPMMRVHYMAFESGSETLRGYFLDPTELGGKGMATLPENLIISTVSPSSASWGDAADTVRQINTMSYKMLKQVADPNRSKYNQYEQFLRNFNNVTSDDGKTWGSIDTWGPNCAIVIDGASGLCRAAAQAVVGGKIDKDQSDYGLMMGLIEETIRRLCDHCACHFILIAHVERETDPILGGSKITISVPGQKLAPKIPPMFSDVILAKRGGKEFFWDTEDPGADLKFRNIPCSSKNPPSFAPLIKRWMARGGKFE